MESNSTIYEFNTKDDLVFDKGKWKIKHKSTKIIQNTYIILLSFIEFNKNKSYDIELSHPIENTIKQQFKSLKNTSFEVRINKVILNFDMSQTLIIEINNKNFNCYQCQSHKIQYTYFNDEIKSFCSDKCLNIFLGPKRPRDGDDNENDEPESKKIKIIPSIDILFIGVDHAELEDLLYDNLMGALNNFSELFNNDKILFKQRNNTYKITHRKGFLIFWESAHIGTKTIDISNLNGKDSLSWKIPAESESLAGFQVLETAFYLFLFPLNFNNEKKPEPLLENQNNEKAINIQKRLLSRHGANLNMINIKKFGLINPAAMFIGITQVIKEFYDVIRLNGENNLSYLEIIIPDRNQCQNLINKIRDIIFLIQETELNKSVVQTELINQINERIHRDRWDYRAPTKISSEDQMVYKNLLIQSKENIFKNDNFDWLWRIILSTGDFSSYYNIIKKFVLETWTIIASHVNTELFKFEEYDDLNIKLNENNNYDIKTIDNNYFLSIFENLKKDLSIDIPTLIYYQTILLYSDGLLLSDTKIQKISPFLQLRNIIFFQNMINICLTTNIKRCITLSGSGHEQHFRKILDNQTKINYNMESYNLQDLKSYKFFSNQKDLGFSWTTSVFFYSLRHKILLYFMYEKIDQWLWKTEQIKISFEDSNDFMMENDVFIDDNTLINYLSGKRLKLQMFSNLIEYFKRNRPDDDIKFKHIHYYIIGLYIYSIIYDISPDYIMINNYYNDYVLVNSDISNQFLSYLNHFSENNNIVYSDIKDMFIDRRIIGENIKFKNFNQDDKSHDNIFDLYLINI
jgi:hypothetical protein